MGEVKRFFGGKEPQMKTLAPGQQIQVDLKNATPRVCQRRIGQLSETGVHEHVCGCELFVPAVKVFTVSPFAPGNNTGQELTAQQPVLICKNCGEVLK